MTTNQLHIQEYTNNLILLAQQEYSVFENIVMKGDAKSERKFFDRSGSVTMTNYSTANQANSYANPTHSKRSVDFTTYAVDLFVDPHIDLSRALIDPTSDYVSLGVAAWKRKIDEVAIAAALGTATDGKDAGTSTVFPTATQTVDLKYVAGDPIGAGNGTSTDTHGTGATRLTIDKILGARATILRNHAMKPGERISMVIGPDEEVDLLGIDQFASNDYTSQYPYDKPIIGNGYVGSVAGVDVFRSSLLEETDPAGAGNAFRSCLMFPMSGLGCYMNERLNVKIGENPERRFATTICITGGLGAVRIDDKKVVEIRTASNVVDSGV